MAVASGAGAVAVALAVTVVAILAGASVTFIVTTVVVPCRYPKRFQEFPGCISVNLYESLTPHTSCAPLILITTY